MDGKLARLLAPLLGELPSALATETADFLAKHGTEADTLAAALDGQQRSSAVRVLAASEFVRGSIRSDADAVAAALADGEYLRARRAGEIGRMVDQATAEAAPETLPGALRLLRRREMTRIAWRDLAGLASLDETLRELSDLADAAVLTAIEAARAEMEERYGVMYGEDGESCSLIALAMGKLGGRELNFSSDIDLIFVYPDATESDGQRPLSAPEYFGRMVRRIVALLGEVTAEGFVFRVDIRLRPFGESGPPVVSFSAMENYLLQHGRDWERYAYVKTRPIADEAGLEAYHELEATVLQPFVYRRYLDFGVFESLRSMKSMIESEVQRREMRDNIKLGPGGIREIEFIVQSWQLVRGGSDRTLQGRELQPALKQLAERRCIGAAAARELLSAYRFLRRLENRRQEFRDRQTHDLPADTLDRERLALAMNCADWDALAAEIAGHRERVSRHFADTVFRTGAEQPSRKSALGRLWDRAAIEDLEEDLAEAGFAMSAEMSAALERLRLDTDKKRLDEVSRRRLDAIMEPLLECLRELDRPAETLTRLAAVLGAVARRSAYLALLLENPAALRRLVDLVSRSGYLATELAAHPVLLDELIDPRIADRQPSAAELRAELETRLAASGAGDAESTVEALARFQRAATFRVAVADFSGSLPIMKVSDRLTEIAEAVLSEALSVAWRDLLAKHGRPICLVDGVRRCAGFAAIGYGKMGGLELGYGSDLDLVFVHDSRGEEQETDGKRSLDNSVFFGRLARRLVHFLTVQTVSGALYEVDTRLRPSGRAGLLVSSIAALERYQRNDAWTWEHQALLRARAVAGDARVQRAFEALRVDILQHDVRRDTLREDVTAMRERMWKELSSAAADEFDIKRDPGGIGDIEFIVQYLVLSGADRHRALLHYTDNIRQLGVLARTAVLDGGVARRLQDIYRLYRTRLHHLALDNRGSIVGAAEFAEEAATVRDIWRRTFG